MKRTGWAGELTSQKFWAAVVGSVTPIMVAAGSDDSTITQVTAIIMGGATPIVYIIDEGVADATATGMDAINKDEVAPR